MDLATFWAIFFKNASDHPGYDQIFAKTRSSLSKKTPIFSPKIITSSPAPEGIHLKTLIGNYRDIID
jgi:hypothetical protein